MWQLLAAAAVQGWLGNQGKKEQAAIDTRLSAVNAEAENRVRRARNAEVAGKNSLARYVQSVNNNRSLDDGGSVYASNIVNGLRAGDQSINEDVLAGVRRLEEYGSAIASQAGAGIGGQVVDMINSTTALRTSISNELQHQSQDTANFEVGQRSKSIMSQMIGGLDSSLIIDSLDHQLSYKQEKYAPSNATAMLTSVMGTAMKVGIGNVAEAGAAALGRYLPDSFPGFGTRAVSSASPFTLDNSAARFGWSPKLNSGMRL